MGPKEGKGSEGVGGSEGGIEGENEVGKDVGRRKTGRDRQAFCLILLHEISELFINTGNCGIFYKSLS